MSLPIDDRIVSTAYQFTDGSVFRPALTRLWFARLFRLLPRRLAANLVTLASTGSLVVMLAMSLDASRWPPTILALAFALLLQIYVAGDHLDGMQAKASRTASPLGDFLDHYCDLWAGCMLVFGFWSLLGDAPRGALYLMLAVLATGFAITFAEREEERRLHFTTLGTLEAIVILTVFFLSWAVPGVRGWWHSPMPGLPGVAWYWVMIATGLAMGVGAIGVIVRRLRRVPAPTIAFVLGLAALSVAATVAEAMRPIEGWLLVTCYGAGYVGRVMHGYLVPGRRSRPDAVATVLALAFAGWLTFGDPAAGAVRVATLVLVAYLAVQTLITLAGILRSLGHYWVWANTTHPSA